MKKPVLTILLSTVFTFPATAGIPVIDIGSITQAILVVSGQAKQLTQLIDQVKTAKTQLDEAKKLYSSVTGSRGMSALANMTGIRQALPPDFLTMANAIQTFGEKGASAGAQSIYNAIKQFGCDKQFPTDIKMQRLCEAQAMAAPASLDIAQQAAKRATARAASLQQMLASVDTADSKAAADLANRIAIEQAMLTNESMMMQLALQSQNLQRELVAQQMKERSTKTITSTDGQNWFSSKKTISKE